MNSNLSTFSQDQLFRDLIQEFKKSEPCDETIKKCMGELNLEHNTDQFANMQRVLTALSFEVQNCEISES